MESEDIKYMDLNEFWELGFLQEVNRNFFHPLGLAISIDVYEETGKVKGFGGVWDYRDDPEGIFFEKGTIDKQKVENIEKLRKSKLIKRSVDLFNCDLDGIQVK